MAGKRLSSPSEQLLAVPLTTLSLPSILKIKEKPSVNGVYFGQLSTPTLHSSILTCPTTGIKVYTVLTAYVDSFRFKGLK